MGLILQRHTTPDIAPGICYGSSDLALADTFDAEARAAMQGLPTPDHIVSSPLQRCLRLAEHMGTHFGLAPDILPGLAEMDFGRWEGVAWDAIPRVEINAWAEDFHHARPHGGESVADLFSRSLATLSPLEDRAGTVLVVTHLGVIRAALAAIDTPDAWRHPLPYGGRFVLPPGTRLSPPR